MENPFAAIRTSYEFLDNHVQEHPLLDYSIGIAAGITASVMLKGAPRKVWSIAKKLIEDDSISVPKLLDEISTRTETKSLLEGSNISVGSPQLPFAGEFAQNIFATLRKSNSGDMHSLLQEVGQTTNNFYKQKFPYTPAVRYRHVAAERNEIGADATRFVVTFRGRFVRVGNDVEWHHFGDTVVPESRIANLLGHESVHCEQDALMYRRKADLEGIGKIPTKEEFRLLAG